MLTGNLDSLDWKLAKAYDTNHFVRCAHDWELGMVGPAGEPVLAMEVRIYTPKHRPRRTPKPVPELIRFEHHCPEELGLAITADCAMDLRDRGAGPPPPGVTTFSAMLDQLIEEIRAGG
jgi:hypothetical protein